jgi:hypothetical protein
LGRSRARRAVVLRRSVKADLAVVEQGVPEPLPLSFAALTDRTILYEDAVPATALPRELPSVAQLDRDPLRNAAPNCGAAEPPATPVPDALAYADEVSQRPPLAAARRAAGIGLAVELAAICTPPAGRKRPAMGVNCSFSGDAPSSHTSSLEGRGNHPDTWGRLLGRTHHRLDLRRACPTDPPSESRRAGSRCAAQSDSTGGPPGRRAGRRVHRCRAAQARNRRADAADTAEALRSTTLAA